MTDFFAQLDQIGLGNITLGTVFSALLTFIILFIVRKLLLKLSQKIIDKATHLDVSVKSFLQGAVGLVLWVIVLLITADRLGIPITSLVAVVTVIGAALSLSLQSILENLFAGMTILATRPLDVGEYVETAGIAGTVRKLGLFHTVLVTPDGREVYVPNRLVTNGVVVNYADEPRRRIELAVTASYDDEPDKVTSALLMAADTTEGALKDPAPMAFVTNYGNSSIEYMLYAWAPGGDFLSVKYALTRRVFYAFRERGVTMTYDHLNLHVIKDPEELQ